MKPTLAFLLGALSIILVHLLLVQPLHAASSKPCHFPAIFNFGSSSSDTGGFSAAFGPIPSPYGETFFKKPAGRTTDGRLVIDFIAESLGLPFLSAYLDSLGANFSHGANFASAGATILPQNQSLNQRSPNPFYFKSQVAQFKQFKNRSAEIHQRGGLLGSLMTHENYFHKALYTVELGINDFAAMFSQQIPPEIYFPKAIQDFSEAIQSIYDEGARYFWIVNLGPIGCLPSYLVNFSPNDTNYDAVGCSITLNNLNIEFNRQLNETLSNLRNKLSDATIIFVDIYSAKYLLFNDAEHYGFNKTLACCCGAGGGMYNFNPRSLCGGGNSTATGPVAVPCANPEQYIIWDGTHYTDAAYKFMFDQISGGDYSYPPLGLRNACKEKSTMTFVI